MGFDESAGNELFPGESGDGGVVASADDGVCFGEAGKVDGGDEDGTGCGLAGPGTGDLFDGGPGDDAVEVVAEARGPCNVALRRPPQEAGRDQPVEGGGEQWFGVGSGGPVGNRDGHAGRHDLVVQKRDVHPHAKLMDELLEGVAAGAVLMHVSQAGAVSAGLPPLFSNCLGSRL